jgi:hypothetical protein
MRHTQYILLLCLFLFAANSGCSHSARLETPSPAADEALRSAQAILESCVRTGKRGDELDNYKQIIDALRPTHRNMATILEKGFEELLTVPESEIRATARTIMAQAQLESDID